MSQFNTTYQGRKVVVNFGFADEPWESLEGVEVYYCDTGEEIDYNNIGESDWIRLHELVKAEFREMQIDAAAQAEWR